MTRRLRVVARAATEIRAASEWWRANRRAAPELFWQELERAFALILMQPHIGPTALEAGLEDVHRLHLYRLCYHLYYRLRSEDLVEILAFWHTSRGGGPRLREDTGG